MVFFQQLLTDKPWYYNACNAGNCNKKIESKDNVCRGCKKEVKSAIPRYMLKVVVRSTDESDESSAVFTLFDRDAKSLLGITVGQAKEKLEKDGKSGEFPDAFDTLFERSCLFRVKVDKHFAGQSNVDSSKNFTVQKLICDPELISHIMSQISKIDDVEIASKPKIDRATVKDFDVEGVKVLETTNEHSTSSSSNYVTPKNRSMSVVDLDDDSQLSTTSIKTMEKIKTEKSD